MSRPMGPCPQHPESWDLGRQTGGGLCPLRVMVLWVSGAGAGLRPHCRAGSWSGSSKRWWEQGGLQADPSLSGQSGLHAEGPAPLLSTPPAMEDRHVQVGEGLRRAVLGSHAMTQKVPVALAGRTVHPPRVRTWATGGQRGLPFRIGAARGHSLACVHRPASAHPRAT